MVRKHGPDENRSRDRPGAGWSLSQTGRIVQVSKDSVRLIRVNARKDGVDFYNYCLIPGARRRRRLAARDGSASEGDWDLAHRPESSRWSVRYRTVGWESSPRSTRWGCFSPYEVAARSRAAMSSFIICIIASSALGCLRSSARFAGTICQQRPNLSRSQPQAISLPPAPSFVQ